MIVPVRCFTCGKVLADKWTEYVLRCEKEDAKRAKHTTVFIKKEEGRTDEERAMDAAPPRGHILNDLGITNGCCRIVMMTTVDMSTII